MIRGIARIRRPAPFENDAIVQDGIGNEWPINETAYREHGYEPPFEALPWVSDLT